MRRLFGLFCALFLILTSVPGSVHKFETHQARLRSLDFQEAGLPIGSGSVESEVKQFKQRLTAPGMHWSRPGAERMIPIRAAVLDGSFDQRWDQAA